MAMNALQLPDWMDEDVAETISRKNIWSSAHRLTRFAAFYSKFDEYFQEEKHTDVNIICEDQIFKCHRVVLAAVSEYFNKMFGDGNFKESRAQDVVLQDMDRVTFGQILLYVYRGEIASINDDNVLSLLRCSDFLGIKEIEEFCVHYLTQKSIPMDRALEIYLFASALDKFSLIPAVGEFIVQHLDRFSEESMFLNMCFKDFSTLLTYFRSSSSTKSRETRLLNAIYKWVRHSTDIQEDRRKSYVELARKVDFKFVTAAYVSEYFDRYSVDSNEESNRSEVSNWPEFDSCVKNNEPLLHVYARTCRRDPDGNGYFGSSILTLRENGTEDINWQFSYHTSSRCRITMMRVVECDGRLYSMKLCKNKLTFSSSTAINLFTNVQSLTTPCVSSQNFFDYADFEDTPGSSFISRLDKRIYYMDLLHNFQSYDIELDVWSPTALVEEKCTPEAIVSDDTRLYIIGKNSEDRLWDRSWNRHFVAYDPRAGKVDELPKLTFVPSEQWSCCYHKGKIHVTDSCEFDPVRHRNFNMVYIYDVAAGRWDSEKFNSNRRNLRFLSFKNRLFKFEFEPNHIYPKVFDSYRQTWSCFSSSYKLCDVLNRSGFGRWSFLDVVAFQS